jgi:hypothetical protein
MTKPEAFVPLIVFILVIAALRLSVNAVVGQASKPSNVVPVTTPFTSPFCGQNNQNCTWKGFETYQSEDQKPFKGLTYPP